MKVLPFTSEEDFNKNEHEISKLRKHQNENVVGLVEVIEGDNAHFVVLELCSCSLADRISELRKLGTMMDRVTVFRILQDVLAGLGFLHSRNEVYGDVKPSNILIGRDGRAKLGDFGGVVGVGTVKTSNAAECGTMQFWAPEMFVVGGTAGSVSQAGDMWAFGLILLELLTGEEWISGRNSVEIADRVKRFDVKAVCKKAKNPQERLSSAELIRSGRLRSILGEETPLSQFIREELESTRSQLSERDRTICRLEQEKELIRKEKDATIEKQAKTIKNQEERIAELKKKLGESVAIEKRLTREEERKRKEEEERKRKEEEERKRKEEEERKRKEEEERMKKEEEERRRNAKEGVAAIEVFRKDKFTVAGNVFKKTADGEYCLLSHSFGAVVVRITFIIRAISNSWSFGVISTDLTEQAKTARNWFLHMQGGAGWDCFSRQHFLMQNYKETHKGTACKVGAVGQRVVMEADGRDGKRTLKLSQDGETQPVFFSNIPVPFRLVVDPWSSGDSVEIVSSEVLREASMVGGSVEVKMD
ncbi:putative Protein kinase domain containing protein [Blattamonas nauphoetae]|uniref:Protein kinase domain-containing protein n=1 Tax=Blattamonas nauphoetae TaxID=2049346 RepID=A0ABQ9Y5K9_9EUKA|nr:putative Protein kinase domain containing protein [Blattamonas nauphoetae]